MVSSCHSFARRNSRDVECCFVTLPFGYNLSVE
jgi:hypothetical protein